MTVEYKSAFEKVILSRWNATPDEQKIDAQFPDRHGQLMPDDPDSYALYDTYNYQRGHVDVFYEAYRQAPHTPPEKGENLLVVDIGAGAATVAVALGKAFKRRERERVDYRAFDTHPEMQQLGKRILRHLGAGFNSAEYVASLEDVDFADADRVLFTFSYVAHQYAVDRIHILQWALLIRRAVVEVERPVELIYTTATLSDGAHLTLEQLLAHANILGEQNLMNVQVPMRYPQPTPSDGQISWKEYSRRWQVQAGHWTLSA